MDGLGKYEDILGEIYEKKINIRTPLSFSDKIDFYLAVARFHDTRSQLTYNSDFHKAEAERAIKRAKNIESRLNLKKTPDTVI